MKSLSTFVLFLVIVWIFQTITDYTIGFILALRDRVHKRIIRKQRRWANRIIKK